MQDMPPTLYQRWARRLIECYPTNWRQRYAEEMLLILEDSPPTFRTILDLFLHLLDAYLHQQLVKERTPYMLHKIRSYELTIYGATLIFFVAWFMIQSHFVDFEPGQGRVLANGFSYTSSPLVNIIHAVAWLLPLFLLLGGLPVLLASIVQALKEHKPGALLLCLLSLVSPLIIVFIALTSSFSWGFMPFGLVIGLSASVAFIVFSVKHVTPGRRITHYAFALASAIPLVMFVGLAALLWKVIPSLVALFLAGDSTLYVLREDLLILIMVGALALSLLSLQKGVRARQAMPGTLA